jgi:hypothetical protein
MSAIEVHMRARSMSLNHLDQLLEMAYQSCTKADSHAGETEVEVGFVHRRKLSACYDRLNNNSASLFIQKLRQFLIKDVFSIQSIDSACMRRKRGKVLRRLLQHDWKEQVHLSAQDCQLSHVEGKSETIEFVEAKQPQSDISGSC